jgi:protein phosphatase
VALQDVLQIVYLSDTGMLREHNEDSVDVHAEWGLVVLADGMGGYNAGEVASEMTTSGVVAGVAQCWDPNGPADHEGALRVLQAQIKQANMDVFDRSMTEIACEGMGTTVVACLFHDNTITVGHIGDSRLYRMRGDVLEQLTRDHSVLQDQIDAGLLTKAEARLSQHKNLVTRALGIDYSEQAELNQYPVQVGDLFLLCSDGLNDMLDDDEILLNLDMLKENLDLCAQQLIQAANDAGGCDNISVILVQVKGSFTCGSAGMA